MKHHRILIRRAVFNRGHSWLRPGVVLLQKAKKNKILKTGCGCVVCYVQAVQTWTLQLNNDWHLLFRLLERAVVRTKKMPKTKQRVSVPLNQVKNNASGCDALYKNGACDSLNMAGSRASSRNSMVCRRVPSNIACDSVSGSSADANGSMFISINFKAKRGFFFSDVKQLTIQLFHFFNRKFIHNVLHSRNVLFFILTFFDFIFVFFRSRLRCPMCNFEAKDLVTFILYVLSHFCNFFGVSLAQLAFQAQTSQARFAVLCLSLLSTARIVRSA